MALRKEVVVVGLLSTMVVVLILVLVIAVIATQHLRAPPPAITGLTALDASIVRYGQIDLVWNPSDAEDFSYYLVYAAEEEITDVTELSPIAQIIDRQSVSYRATRYRVPGLNLALYAFMQDSEYWFAVTATDLDFNESKVETSISATIEEMPLAPLTPDVFITLSHLNFDQEVVGVIPSVFQPASVTVRIGTTVAWANIDDREVGCFAVRNPHTVTSDTGLFQGDLAGGLMGTDEVFSYTFTETGIFSYHCELHPGESGTVIVEEALAG